MATKIYILCLAISLLTCMAVRSAFAQTQIRFSNTPQNSIGSIWSLQIQQFNSSTLQVYLLAGIREKNSGELYKARSALFMLEPGETIIDEARVQPLEVLFSRIPGEELPAGSYWFQVVLVDASQNRELVSCVEKTELFGRSSNRATLPTIPQTSESLRPGLTKYVQTDGTLRLFYNFQSPQPENTRYPPQYVRSDLQTGICLYKLPLQINGFVSTERQAQHQLNFSLDKAALQEQALRYLTSKMSPEQLFDSTDMQKAEMIRNMFRDKRYPDYEKWKNKLDTFHIESAKKAAEQLNAIKSTLGNAAIRNKLSELESYKSKYKIKSAEQLFARHDEISDSLRQKLMGLFRLEESIRKMEKQQEALKDSAKIYNKYAKTYKKVKNIERKKNISELATASTDLRAGMKIMGRLSKVQNLLLGLDEFEIGSCYPHFSSTTLSGIRVQGINVSWTSMRNYHIGVAAGKKRADLNIDTNFTFLRPAFFPRSVFGIQLGIGHPNNNYVYIQHIRSREYGSPTINVDGIIPAHSDNYITGLAFRYKDNRQIFSIQGEINQSLFNPDLASPKLPANADYNLNSWWGGFQRTGSALDYSYNAATRINLADGATRFSAFINHVGPGYNSFGSPFLQQNTNRYEVRTGQDFFKKVLQVEAWYKRDFDQTNPYSEAFRVISTGYGANMNIKPSKNSQISFNYAPYSTLNSGYYQDSVVQKQGNILISSCQLKWGKNASQIVHTVSWLHQNYRQQTDVSFRTNSFLQSSQLIARKYRLALSTQFGRRYSGYYGKTNLVSSDLSATFVQLMRKTNISFGVQYMKESNIVGLKGVYSKCNIILGKHLSLDLNIRHSYIARPALHEYFTQDNGWVVLLLRW